MPDGRNNSRDAAHLNIANIGKRKLYFTTLLLTCRSTLKQKANKRHEEEKDFMATLQGVGIDTSLYTSHSAAQPESHDPDEDPADEPAIQFDDSVDVTPSDGKPLLFFYDCETTGGTYHRDHITEVAAIVAVPDGVHFTNTEYSSLCHTSRHIARKGNKC